MSKTTIPQDSPPVEAIVGSVIGKGRNRYAAAFTTGKNGIPKDTGITFTVHEAWRGASEPHKGQVVHLYGVQQFVKGLRAMIALPVGLSSEQKAGGQT